MSHGSGVDVFRLKPLVRAAIQNGNSVLVAEYLANGGEVNARDQRGRTPLMLAASKGHSELCALLLEYGADSSTRDDEGQTASEIARCDGWPEVALLIDSYLQQSERNPLPEVADFSVSNLIEDWQPEIAVAVPIENLTVRTQVLSSQGVMRLRRRATPLIRNSSSASSRRWTRCARPSR